MDNKDTNKEKDLGIKLDTVLNKDCKGEECKIEDPDELVRIENKKIITNDGRELLSEYTTK